MGVLVLYVRLPVITTPLLVAGVACATLPVIVIPLDNVPVLVTVEAVTLHESVPAVVNVPLVDSEVNFDPADSTKPLLMTMLIAVLNAAPVAVTGCVSIVG
jgi:hypothetical protein